MILADSILQTASIARWVSVAVTATHHTIFNPPVQGQGLAVLGLCGRVGAGVRFVYLAKLALTFPDYLEKILGQLDSFFLGPYLQDSEAAKLNADRTALVDPPDVVRPGEEHRARKARTTTIVFTIHKKRAVPTRLLCARGGFDPA